MSLHEHNEDGPITEPAPFSIPSATTERSPQASALRAPREMYRAPHKALRFLLANLLLKMGTTSFDDVSQSKALLWELGIALTACDEHIGHEDDFVRPALVGRAQNATETLDAEHREHAQQVSELRALATALDEAATADARRALGYTLYLHFSVFVAETLSHMAYEERVVQPLLNRLFSTKELDEINNALVSSIAPAAMLMFMRAMIPGSNREERAETLAEVKALAPPAVFDGLMNELRPHLSSDDWTDLCSRLAV